MRTSTLFVMGLALGGLLVFTVRALSLDDGEPTKDPDAAASVAGAPPADPHASAHDATEHDRPSAGPADAPSPPDADAPDPPDEDRPPENRICPVMGNPVDPEVFVDHEGRRIGFCCPGCDTLFLEEPAKYLKKVDAELAARKATDADRRHDDAPGQEAEADEGRPPENEICPVMGNPVDPEVYVDYEGRRIGFCCPGCDRVFLEDPELYLKKVDAELRKRGGK